MGIWDYKCILAVYESNSWAEAADATFQSPANLSKRVKHVETELGVTIFDRSKRTSIVLTPIGKTIIPHIQKLVAISDSINTYADSLKNKKLMDLSVGYIPLIGSIGIEEILSRFRAQKDVQINFCMRHNNDLLTLLCEDKIDCAFLFLLGNAEVTLPYFESMSENDIVYIPIMRHTNICIGVSEKHPLADRESVRLADLADETFVFNAIPNHYSKPNSYMDMLFNISLDRPMPASILRLDFLNHDMVKNFIAQGKGVLPTACMPRDIPGIRFLKLEDGFTQSTGIFAFRRYSPKAEVRLLALVAREYAKENGVS